MIFDDIIDRPEFDGLVDHRAVALGADDNDRKIGPILQRAGNEAQASLRRPVERQIEKHQIGGSFSEGAQPGRWLPRDLYRVAARSKGVAVEFDVARIVLNDQDSALLHVR